MQHHTPLSRFSTFRSTLDKASFWILSPLAYRSGRKWRYPAENKNNCPRAHDWLTRRILATIVSCYPVWQCHTTGATFFPHMTHAPLSPLPQCQKRTSNNIHRLKPTSFLINKINPSVGGALTKHYDKYAEKFCFFNLIHTNFHFREKKLGEYSLTLQKLTLHCML